MITKEELMKLANKGNWHATPAGSEIACNSCYLYHYENRHEDDCPLGALLKLIKELFKII